MRPRATTHEIQSRGTSVSAAGTRLAPRTYLAAAALALSCASLGAEAPPAAGPAPSAYAPAKELRSQVDYYLGRIREDLQVEADYGDDQKNRVALDANTIAAVALVLGVHDQPNDVKPVAGGVIAAAQRLTKAAKDYKQAQAALAEVEAALAASAEKQPVTQKPVADLTLLMKQVPIVNNTLRRGVTSRRFADQAEATAGHAAALAALAQASSMDTSYCSDAAEEASWRAICGQLRDASAKVLAALAKKDQPAAVAGLDEVVKSCDACHHKFRDQ